MLRIKQINGLLEIIDAKVDKNQIITSSNLSDSDMDIPSAKAIKAYTENYIHDYLNSTNLIYGIVNSYQSSIGNNAISTVDSFDLSLSSAVEWSVYAQNGTDDYVIQKIVAYHDTINVNYNEYSIISKGEGLNDLSVYVDIDSNLLRLRLINNSSIRSYSVKIQRNII